MKSMSEKKKMKSYLVECLSTRSTLKKNCAKKVIEKIPLKKTVEKKTVFFHEKNREVGRPEVREEARRPLTDDTRRCPGGADDTNTKIHW